MAARTRRTRPEVEPEPGDPSESATESRDYVMARLAAARAALQEGLNSVDEALSLFLTPDHDKNGSKREESIDCALEWSGAASRAIEAALTEYDSIDPTETEPWD